jgi:SAM-dependent methyltransferase
LKNKTEWFDDENFWKTYAPIMFDDVRWQEVEAVADGLTRFADLDLYRAVSGVAENAPRCLEQCCGFGRIALEMARRGFAVTGVDITRPYLETAQSDADCDALSIELVEGDVRAFRRENFFNLAYNVYISFGYCDDAADDRLVVKNACDSLMKGGVYIVETLGKEIAVRDFTSGEWFERAGFFVLTEYEAADSWNSLKNRWILINQKERSDLPKGAIFEKTFHQRLYSAEELRRLFLEAGFGKVDIYGNWAGEKYDQNARSLIVVGKK